MKMIGRCKAQLPNGHWMMGYVVDRGVDRMRYLVKFDDGGSGWVHPKNVYFYDERDNEKAQMRLI